MLSMRDLTGNLIQDFVEKFPSKVTTTLLGENSPCFAAVKREEKKKREQKWRDMEKFYSVRQSNNEPSRSKYPLVNDAY